MKRSERVARWKTCADYIVRAGDLPRAQKLAKQEGFSAPTVAWLSALGKMLEKMPAETEDRAK